MGAALPAAATGFATAFSLILAIGAQNAFVLRQALLGAHVLPLVAFCALSDAVLIAAGVMGFGAVVEAAPMLPGLMALGGAAFLVVYGALRFAAAWRGDGALVLERGSGSLAGTLGMAAALTWLNPHVYLDTLALIGAISTRFEGTARLAFALGAMFASGVFFTTLGYGARLLAPMMQRPGAWRVLDGLIGATMWALAAGLLLSQP